MRYTGIDGAVAVVTGAAGGIGSAVVDALASQGATVAALDRDADRLEKTVAAAVADRRDVVALPVDVTDAALVADAIDRVENEVGPIAILVNAAGVMRTGPLLELESVDWAETFAVNATAVFEVSRLVARRMAARHKGCVITVASNAATVARVGMSAYCASKAAAAMLTRCLGLEVARYGIRCNTVSPGSTDTPMLRALWTDESGPAKTLGGSLDEYRLGIPLRRIATPADIADAVTFLAADQARHITMHDLCVDGGATLGC
jgi:2,3-dihydro-2,3-dihydroxybenzoate dehydrogenase